MKQVSHLPLVAFFDPVTRSSGFALMELAVAATVDAEVMDGLDSYSLTALTRFMWMALVSVCVAPLVAVALIGEIAKVRTIVWYAGATGAAAASAPWLIRAALRLPRAGDYDSVELRFALIFFIHYFVVSPVFLFSFFGLLYLSLCLSFLVYPISFHISSKYSYFFH